MFGYIRPVKGELKVKEFEHFKACYCAMCHSLKMHYGLRARFILNFDFVFLAMLLWPTGIVPDYRFRRCVASPIRKKCYCADLPELERCAGYSVILTWWKLRDAVQDEGFFKSLLARTASVLLRRPYKKAVRKYIQFDTDVAKYLHNLREMEVQRNGSLDGMADQFAGLLAGCATGYTGRQRRVLEQILYHIGRWIYILDAFDDREEDQAAGRFNILSMRFPNSGATLCSEDMAALETTLRHSLNLIGSSYELMEENYWAPVIRNIIYLGMPAVCCQVLNGTWKKPKDRVPK
jgi:hypothetical protein